MSRALGVPFRPRYLPARAEVAHVHPSHEKARALLGYRSTVELDEGVDLMAAWVRQVGARASRSFGALEIERDLPPSWREPPGTATRGG